MSPNAANSPTCSSSTTPMPTPQPNNFNGSNLNSKQEEYVRPCSKNSSSSSLVSGIRRRILHFTPSWFSINMGTGIASILLYTLPFQVDALKYIGIAIFVLNIILFCLFLLITLTRYIIWPRIFTLMLFHPTQSLFLGTFPMGLATIINMIVYVTVPSWGRNMALFAWGLWWIDVILSFAISIGVTYFMFERHNHSIDSMTPTWMLPIVSNVVAATSGGIVADVLQPQEAKITILTSYVVWGLGVPFAFIVMPIYFHRLCVHKFPHPDQIVSVFLLVGPCGQGSLGIILLSKMALKLVRNNDLALFPNALSSSLSSQDLQLITSALHIVTLVVALVIWGVGLFWFVISISTVLHQTRKGGFNFNLGWWGFTFPVGVWAASANEMSRELDSTAFKVIGTVLSTMVILFWVVIATRTAIRAWTGVIFNAPCLGPSGQPPAKSTPPDTPMNEIMRA